MISLLVYPALDGTGLIDENLSVDLKIVLDHSF